MRRTRTTCRICESRCGVIVESEADIVRRILPDPTHPVSRGYACAKGTQFAAAHHSPARLQRPIVDGRALSWDHALASVGKALGRVRSTYGKHAIALYSGNAVGHSLGGVLGVSAFQTALGTPRHYSALTLDNADQLVVLEAVTGSPLHSFAADFAQSDMVVLFGTDILTSQAAQSQSSPRGVSHLRTVADHGGLWVVDPRPSRTARHGTHLAVRPGSDVALLAWLLREALARGVRDPRVRAGDLDTLAGSIQRFDRDLASEATGLSPELLEQLRTRLLAAKHPCVWTGLGVLLGPDGTIGYWLTLALQLALGGLESPGGWRTPPCEVNMGALANRLGLRASDPSLRGRHGHPATMGTLPSADLAEDIESGDVRALIVVGGNPVLALPDHARAIAAFSALEYLVSIDLFTNDTGTLAHALLPARSWLSRSDMPLHVAGQRWSDGERHPITFEPAAVSPCGESREDLHILLDLAQATGEHAFGSRIAHTLLRNVHSSTIGRLGTLAGRLGGPSRPLGRSHHEDGLLHLAIPAFLGTLDDWEPPTTALRIVTSARATATMNHWLHGSRAALRHRPLALVHPETAAAHGITGAFATLHGAEDLRVEVRLDPDLARDTVVLPFGWGHLPGAVESGGTCANQLIRTEPREPFTGQPTSNGQMIRMSPTED